MSIEAWISLGVTIIVFGIFFLMVLETRLLASRHRPITFYTRSLVRRYPGSAFVVVGCLLFVVGLLLAHFGWDSNCGIR